MDSNVDTEKKNKAKGNPLKALLKKNLILTGRNKCGICCELGTPLGFFVLLYLIRTLVDVKTYNEVSYFSSTDANLRALNVFDFKDKPSVYDSTKDSSFATAYAENQKIMTSDLIKNCYISNGKTVS